jgi:hypothetical protein
MIQVYVASSLPDAEFVCGELVAAGVPAIVKGEALTMTGHFASVWVPASHEAQAREIMAERDAGDADATGTSEELTP